MLTLPQSSCPNCGSSGTEAYADLRDAVYGTPGQWRMQRCVAPQCGAYWSDPAVHPEDLPLAYRGYYTQSADQSDQDKSGFRIAIRDTYSAQHLNYPVSTRLPIRLGSLLVNLLPEHRETALYLRFYLHWKEGGKLLEVGCGSGAQLELMQRSGWDASGVDFDPETAAAARSRGLRVDVGDLRTLKYPEASFDAIVMAHVIEHVYDPVGLLTECQRLLKPGGQLVVITPNAASLGHRIYRHDWRGLEPPRHMVVFTPRALLLAAERAGLTVRHTRVTARDAANLLHTSSRIKNTALGVRVTPTLRGTRAPLLFRIFGHIERIANLLGLQWGEELVLIAQK